MARIFNSGDFNLRRIIDTLTVSVSTKPSRGPRTTDSASGSEIDRLSHLARLNEIPSTSPSINSTGLPLPISATIFSNERVRENADTGKHAHRPSSPSPSGSFNAGSRICSSIFSVSDKPSKYTSTARFPPQLKS